MPNKINFLFFSLYLAAFGEFVLSSILNIQNSSSIIFFLVDLIVFSIAISFLKINSRYAKYLLILFLISSVTFLLNSEASLMLHINGLREILFPISLLIIFERLFASQNNQGTIKRFKQFAFIFLSIQIPVCIIQFLQFGPGDFVGGTIGKGGSGVLTFSIFILVYFLMELKTKPGNVKEKFFALITLIPFFIPVALNETKVTFILILFLFLSFVNFKKLGASIIAVSLGLAMLIVFSSLYSTQEKQSFSNPLTGIYSKDFITFYLAGEGDEYVDVPRFTKLVFGSNYLFQNDKLIFGQSYSLFKEGKVYKSNFYRKYEWLLVGSRPYLFYLLFSGGLSLVLLFLTIFLREFKSNKNEKNAFKKSSFNVFLLTIFLLLLFYNDGMRFHVLGFIFMFSFFYSKSGKYTNNIFHQIKI
jgi:hypothetical protein